MMFIKMSTINHVIVMRLKNEFFKNYKHLTYFLVRSGSLTFKWSMDLHDLNYGFNVEAVLITV
jgi:hypothetical protein